MSEASMVPPSYEAKGRFLESDSGAYTSISPSRCRKSVILSNP
jgi:hypothetical protein